MKIWKLAEESSSKRRAGQGPRHLPSQLVLPTASQPAQHGSATTALPCASNWESQLPLSSAPPPTEAPPFSMSRSVFILCTPNSKPGGLAGSCQAPWVKTPFEQSIPPTASPTPPLPLPRCSPVLGSQPPSGPGWQPMPAPPPSLGRG